MCPPFVIRLFTVFSLLLFVAGQGAQGKPVEKPDPKWWSLQPLKVLAVPPMPAGGRNELDAFLAARLTAERQTFSPEAPRAVLLRRAAFDLTDFRLHRRNSLALKKPTAPDAFERSGPAARLSGLWRKMGASLARYCPLWRERWLRIRQAALRSMALSRLGHPRAESGSVLIVISPSNKSPAMSSSLTMRTPSRAVVSGLRPLRRH